ncbi:hypothetical protein Ancab_006344 [Ancistrocladus abbreviatus]
MLLSLRVFYVKEEKRSVSGWKREIASKKEKVEIRRQERKSRGADIILPFFVYSIEVSVNGEMTDFAVFNLIDRERERERNELNGLPWTFALRENRGAVLGIEQFLNIITIPH